MNSLQRFIGNARGIIWWLVDRWRLERLIWSNRRAMKKGRRVVSQSERAAPPRELADE
jgi:hypothetical protein